MKAFPRQRHAFYWARLTLLAQRGRWSAMYIRQQLLIRRRTSSMRIAWYCTKLVAEQRLRRLQLKN